MSQQKMWDNSSDSSDDGLVDEHIKEQQSAPQF